MRALLFQLVSGVHGSAATAIVEPTRIVGESGGHGNELRVVVGNLRHLTRIASQLVPGFELQRWGRGLKPRSLNGLDLF